MSPVVMAIVVLCLYVLFYRFYAKGFLGKKILKLDEHAVTPAHAL
ncbi:MAG: carbon starvation CstA family protein, partial [Mariprofundaceae bacterium]|nr:carbon starvation CstA family protein [Mariprofundaceae bacterium]